MKTDAIVKVCMGSSRLAGKVIRQINGIPMIELLMNCLNKAKHIDKVIAATTPINKERDLIEHVKKLEYEVYHGSKGDVLDRYYQASKLHMP